MDGEPSLLPDGFSGVPFLGDLSPGNVFFVAEVGLVSVLLGRSLTGEVELRRLLAGEGLISFFERVVIGEGLFSLEGDRLLPEGDLELSLVLPLHTVLLECNLSVADC
jgi:hypothetical protein